MSYVAIWWRMLLHPDEAARIVRSGGTPVGFFRGLSVAICLMYGIYGASMGLFGGALPGVVSACKMPMLYGATLAVCFPAFYVANGLVGPRLSVRACTRLLLLAVSANAVALSSYAPLSYFFTFTTSASGYPFIVLMHMVVFALAGLVSLAVVIAIFRSSAEVSRRIRPAAVGVWGLIYGLVGSEMAWVLRPWIGWGRLDYTPFRPLQESFFESMVRVIQLVF
jgi:hypothetical protein